MAATLKVIVAGFATFVEEFLEEESVQEGEDVLEEFLPLFYANNLLSERRKAVRIEGYAETVVPNYNLSEFRSHFRIAPCKMDIFFFRCQFDCYDLRICERQG